VSGWPLEWLLCILLPRPPLNGAFVDDRKEDCDEYTRKAAEQSRWPPILLGLFKPAKDMPSTLLKRQGTKFLSMGIMAMVLESHLSLVTVPGHKSGANSDSDLRFSGSLVRHVETKSEPMTEQGLV
jgi:hypothetical protein